MLFTDPMDWTWGDAGALDTDFPRASHYRYRYRVNTITGVTAALFLIILL